MTDTTTEPVLERMAEVLHGKYDHDTMRRVLRAALGEASSEHGHPQAVPQHQKDLVYDRLLKAAYGDDP